MDSSYTIKPRTIPSPRVRAYRDPVTVREAVDTGLDPSKVVSAADAGGNHPEPHHQPHEESSAGNVIIDPAAREALFNAVDIRSGQAEQSPNQVLMRQRAYRHREGQAQAPNSDAAAAAGNPHADIEA